MNTFKLFFWRLTQSVPPDPQGEKAERIKKGDFMKFRKILDDYFLFEYRLFRITLEKNEKERRLKNEFYEEEMKIDFNYLLKLWSFYLLFLFFNYKKSRYIRKTFFLYLKIKKTAKNIYYMENQKNEWAIIFVWFWRTPPTKKRNRD